MVSVSNKKMIGSKWIKNSDSDIFTAYLLLAPFLILWLIWFFYPFIQSFLISFQHFDFSQMDQSKFVGLENYTKLLVNNPEFYEAIGHTVIIVLVAVPLQTVFALALAMALNQDISGKGIFRTVYIIPNITSGIAAATVFMVLFRKDMIFTKAFALLGFPNDTWTAKPDIALLFVIILYVWQQVGFYMIIYLAGLQTISRELYEAARVDGANWFQQFKSITVPSLKPVTFLIVSVGTIQAFQIFDQIAAISRYGKLGSPADSTTTLITYFFTHGIRYPDEMGLGCASVIIFLFIVLGITLVQKKLLEEKE
ncbi:MAG: sugar ABC transporter permease [Clostridia bacterium]|nr:sugar ABC transporter permease [Clostridia bacterium]